jgi:hypothetical protein
VSTISLKNEDYPNGVKVNARVGSDDDPDANRDLGMRMVGFNDTWDIDAGTDDAWYRTDRDPDHPTNEWSNWTRISNFGSDRDERIAPG